VFDRWACSRLETHANFSNLELNVPQPLPPNSVAIENKVHVVLQHQQQAAASAATPSKFEEYHGVLEAEQQELYELISQEQDCDQEFYDKMVRKLVLQGKLNEALEVADSYLPDGASDFLLHMLIEKAEDKSTTWQLVMRLRDKELAAQFVFTWLESWDDIEVCIDLLFMLKCHLPERSETRVRTDDLYEEMRLFRDVLRVDSSWKGRWQPLAGVCRRSPAQAVRNLTQLRQHHLARALARQFSVPNVKREIEENHLLELLEKHKDTNEATKALIALDDEALPVAEALMDKVHEDSLRLFLVQYLISHLSRPVVPGAAASSARSTPITTLEALRAMERGIRAVMALPESLQPLYRPLARRPDLIVHNLIMTEQITQAERLFQALPELRDDAILVFYAKKAIRFERKPSSSSSSSSAFASSESLAFDGPGSSGAATSGGVSVVPTSSSASSLLQPSGSHDDNRRSTIATSASSGTSQSLSSSVSSGFTSWMKRRVAEVEGDSQLSRSLRANTGFGLPQRAGGGVRATIGTDADLTFDDEAELALGAQPRVASRPTTHVPASALARQPAAPGLPLLGEDDDHDTRLQNEYTFVAAPSINLLKSLLDMCADAQNAGIACWELCDQLSEKLNRETEDRLFLTNLMHQLLLYGRLQFLKTPDGSNRAALCDTLLSHVDLMQSLVISKCPIPVRLLDFSDPHKLKLLRDELIRDDRVRMALDVGTKCGIGVEPVWASWGLSVLKMGRYSDAKEKFVHCLKERGTHFQVENSQIRLVNQIIAVLENPIAIELDSKELRRTVAQLGQNKLRPVEVRCAHRFGNVDHRN